MHTISFTVYITQDSAIMIFAGTKALALDELILYFSDEDVHKIQGVSINQLDTYNVGLNEMSLIHQPIDMLERFSAVRQAVGGRTSG